jgi:hypothetical protein
MTVKVTEKMQEMNAVELKIIEKDGSIKRLSEQLESKFLQSHLTLLSTRRRHVN